jgi:hypothetical protein
VPLRLLACVVGLLAALTACTEPVAGSDTDSQDGQNGTASGSSQVAPAPAIGACRDLSPADIAEKANATETVPCGQSHTAETYLVGYFRGELAKAAYDDPALAARAYDTCTHGFRKFTGADDSLVLRSVLTWAWFRPTEQQWEDGARWYRCDLVGGTDQSPSLVTLPRTGKGVLLGIPGDRWMACVDGAKVAGAPHVPCTEKHTWRAVTTIVVGDQKDRYPGDRLVEVQTRDYCSDSVGAWMNYPIDYQFAYTWFHEAEWQEGNRRSVCWAGTTE